MVVEFSTAEHAPVSFFRTNEIGLNVTGLLTVRVEDDVACIIRVNVASGSLSANLTDFRLIIQLLTFQITDSNVVFSSIGDINVWGMR